MNFSLRKPLEPPIYHPQVILASQSVGRKTLLEKLGIRFRVLATHIDEEQIIDKDPIKMLKRRAQAKAEEIVKHPNVYGISQTTKTLVIAADSMAILGTKTFGKAKDREDAKRILQSLMGKMHSFATAVSIILLDQGKETQRWEKEVTTKVTMRKLTQPELDLYVARFDFSRFAAGYALNETPWDLVTKIDGSYTNVIGMPFEILLPILRKLEIII
ncbi:MAG: Maf family nucleotide pyrophosphatase [bacterium]|nr:Maf family nucleotide pyrophosphatase [bacterium]